MIVFCLLIAAYMFAALKFPALRFIFRLKRFAAGAVGMDGEDNRKLSESLGLILCPLIGVGALVAAVWLGFDWKKTEGRQQQFSQARDVEFRRTLDEATAVLTGAGIEDVYFESYGRYGVDDDGRNRVEKFVGRLREEVSPQMISRPITRLQDKQDALVVSFKPLAESTSPVLLTLFPDRGELGIWFSRVEGIPLVLSDELVAAMSGLRDLEKIDLQALKREENRRKNEEEKRLRDYREKTYLGSPAWELYDLVHAVPEGQQEAKRNEFVGMKFDWECRLLELKEADGKLEIRISQNRPDAGRCWAVRFESDREMITRPITDTSSRFVRIRGAIESLDETKGVFVRVDELEYFEP